MHLEREANVYFHNQDEKFCTVKKLCINADFSVHLDGEKARTQIASASVLK